MHLTQETGKRPTAALDRNLAYLGLVEILHGYPLDGVVLTTGCDKTTPACSSAIWLALIDPGRRLSRTRLFPEVTRIMAHVVSTDG